MAALTRELREELGITVQAARPLIQIPHDYPDRRVWLDVWWVEAWNGEPRGLEGQPIRWVKIEDLDVRFLPAADAPVITAIRLPSVYLISPEPGLDHERFLHSLAGCLQSGIRLVQLRAKQLDGSRYRELARRTLELCKSYHATLLLNAEPSLTMALGADGVHLSSERLLTVRKRPLGQECWVGASCHSPQELAHACCIDVDFAVLSPVSRTASHPTASPLGWARFQALVAAATIPVYALGGMGIADLRTAWGCGAQGIAASSAIWHRRCSLRLG